MESRARLGGEVGEEEEGVHLHVITIACVRPYITGCRRPWLETDAQFTVRKDIRRKKEACWTSDKSVLGLDQDLYTKSYFLKIVTFFTKKQGTHLFFSLRIGLTLYNGTGGLLCFFFLSPTALSHKFTYLLL